MNYYDKRKIDDLVEEHGSNIQRIELGLAGNWHGTSAVIYEDGAFKNMNELEDGRINVRGETGSRKLKPLARVYRHQGAILHIEVGSEDVSSVPDKAPKSDAVSTMDDGLGKAVYEAVKAAEKPKPAPKRKPAPRKPPAKKSGT